ncbi:hypothetical protein SEHO0A_01691 [Salmonella enterica subsp. houtenae str. ATCC BAA-1581]|nr:hypothetical protein SEHO0A_01691 [Salmonella enterica subsp. houtenae str. ATCC BAA-1581]ENZ86792.1 hypothetical protein D088_690057 [Salmonella enterica subsp. houtenae serovar 16:z4,z32:-- str. RKS3027]
MMGTASGANWVNGVHSTCSAGKLTGSIDTCYALASDDNAAFCIKSLSML